MRRNRFRLLYFRYLIYLLVFLIPALYTVRSRRLPPAERYLVADEAGVVTYVYDGDTVRIKLRRGEKKVRLLGVDAPEIGAPSEEVDLWASIARRFAYFYLFKRNVILTWDKEHQDSYGRLLGYLWLDERILFNELIIREGLARYLEAFPLRPEMEQRFRQAEEEARREKKGRWAEGWPPAVKDFEAINYLGQLRAVELICGQIKRERNYTLLLSARSHFQAFIPRGRRSLFRVLEKIKKGDRLFIFGLIEDYRGRPQVSLFSPKQLRVNF